MKVYIMTDLEGPCHVNRWEQTRVAEVTPAKQYAMLRLTEEVNAAVEGIRDVDPAATVVVLDGHGSGGIDAARFHPQAHLLAHGRGLRSPYGLDETFDAVLFIGQHAMAGTAAAPLCHTMSSKTVEYYRINGNDIGEIALFAYTAGALGVPTVFLSGDDKACLEASALVPAIGTVATKLGLGIELALHRPVATVLADIRAGVADSLRRRGDVPPTVLAGPYHMEARVLPDCNPSGYLARSADARQLDERTVALTSDKLNELFYS